MFRLASFMVAFAALLAASMVPLATADAARSTATFTRSGINAYAGFTGGTLPAELPVYGGYPVDAFFYVDDFSGSTTSDEGTSSFSGSTLFVDAFILDPQTFELLAECHASADLADNDFTAEQLASASLDAEIAVECLPVAGGAPVVINTEVALDWEATQGRSGGHFHSRDEFFQASFNSRGVRSEASGLITLNGIEVEVLTTDAGMDLYRERGRCFIEECFI